MTRACGTASPARGLGCMRRRPRARRSGARGARRSERTRLATFVRRAVEAELAARCSSRSSVQRTGMPSFFARQPEQDDVDVHRGLDSEAAARVRWSDEPQPRARKAEGRGGDGVEGEGALEVRPRGERPVGLVPVGDDAVRLQRARRPARELVRALDDDVGLRERVLDLAIGEGAVGDDLPLRRSPSRVRAARTRPRSARAASSAVYRSRATTTASGSPT